MIRLTIRSKDFISKTNGEQFQQSYDVTLADVTEKSQMLVILMSKDVGNVSVQFCKVSYLIKNTDFGTKKPFLPFLVTIFGKLMTSAK